MERQVSIYSLVDPRNNEVRYVGKAFDARKRFLQHIKPRSDQKMTPVKSWIKSLLAAGLRPELRILATCSADQWEKHEIFWISHFRSAGVNLTNMADGGNQPKCPDSVHKANAAVLHSSDAKCLRILSRAFYSAKRLATENNQPERWARFDAAAEFVRNARGAARDRLVAYAKTLDGCYAAA